MKNDRQKGGVNGHSRGLQPPDIRTFRGEMLTFSGSPPTAAVWRGYGGGTGAHKNAIFMHSEWLGHPLPTDSPTRQGGCIKMQPRAHKDAAEGAARGCIKMQSGRIKMQPGRVGRGVRLRPLFVVGSASGCAACLARYRRFSVVRPRCSSLPGVRPFAPGLIVPLGLPFGRPRCTRSPERRKRRHSGASCAARL